MESRETTGERLPWSDRVWAALRRADGRTRLVWTLYAAAFAAVGFHLDTALFEIWRALSSPVQIDFGEGIVLNYVALLVEQGNYFTPSDEYPLVHGAYPPLFPLLALPLYQAIGPSLWATRLVSLIAGAALLLFVGRLVRHVMASRALGLLVPGMVLVSWLFRFWAPLGRVDVLALALSTAGLDVFLRHADEDKPQRYWAFLLFCLAWSAKQTAIAAPGAVFLWAALCRDQRRHLPRYLAAYLLPVLLVVGLCHGYSGGEFYDHIFAQWGVHEFAWARAWHYFHDWYLDQCLVLVLLVGATVLAFRRRLVTGSTTWILLLHAAIAAVLYLSTGKSGSNANYTLEPMTSLYIAAAIAAARLIRAQWVWEGPLTLAMLCLFLWVGKPFGTWDGLDHLFRPPLSSQQRAELRRLIRQAPGEVIAVDMSEVVFAGRTNPLQLFDQVRLYEAGKWDGQPLLRDCWAGRFPLVVWYAELKTIPSLDACLRARYRRVAAFEDTGCAVWRHRSWLADDEGTTRGQSRRHE